MKIPSWTFLRGQVVLEDGSPLPEPARVQLICPGSVRAGGETSSDGAFQLQIASQGGSAGSAHVGQEGSRSWDSWATTRGRQDPIRAREAGKPPDLKGCKLLAELPGSHQGSIRLDGWDRSNTPDAGVIVLRPSSRSSPGTISLAKLSVPKKAGKAYERALKELKRAKPNFSSAAKSLEKAVRLHPGFATAWHLLGVTRLGLSDVEGARQAYERSIGSDSTYIEAYLDLIALEMSEECWLRASDLCAVVLEMNPSLVQAQFLHAAANLNLGRLDLAEQSIQKVRVSKDTRSQSGCHYITGVILAVRGRFEAAAREFHSFLEMVPQGEMADQLREKLATWVKEGLIGVTETSSVEAPTASLNLSRK